MPENLDSQEFNKQHLFEFMSLSNSHLQVKMDQWTSA
jgi:hypothetical protein